MHQEWFERFICYPPKKRYGFMISSFGLIFFIVYFLILSPLYQQYDENQLDVLNKKSKLDVLKSQSKKLKNKQILLTEILQLQNRQVDSLKDIKESIFNSIEKNHLSLVEFTHYFNDEQSDENSKITLKIAGEYQDFIKLIDQFSRFYPTLLLDSLTIMSEVHSEKNRSLIFELYFIFDSIIEK